LIKGVNKKIIDIKCTNSEYFDRALLFVNANCMFSENENEELAKKYVARLTKEFKDGGECCHEQHRTFTKNIFAVLPWLIAAAALAAAIRFAL